MSTEKKQETGVIISRETGSNGHALLRFTGPPKSFRPFQLGYTKLKMIVEHQTEVCQFIADEEQARAKKAADEAAKAAAAKKAEADPTTQAIIAALQEGTISRADLLAALREAADKEAGPTIITAAPAEAPVPASPAPLPASPALPNDVVPEPDDKVGLVNALAKMCKQYSYNSVGKKIGVGGTSIKAWCRAAEGSQDAKKAWWPTDARLVDIYLFLQLWQERDPTIIVGLTKVGGNRGWKGD